MQQDLDPGLFKQISQEGYYGLYSQHDSIYSPVENDNDRGNLGWEDYVKSILQVAEKNYNETIEIPS